MLSSSLGVGGVACLSFHCEGRWGGALLYSGLLARKPRAKKRFVPEASPNKRGGGEGERKSHVWQRGARWRYMQPPCHSAGRHANLISLAASPAMTGLIKLETESKLQLEQKEGVGSKKCTPSLHGGDENRIRGLMDFSTFRSLKKKKKRRIC